MTTGTKSLLFGIHQFIFHPLLVFIAWIKFYKQLPNIKEIICIIIHDWGYWGVEDIKGEEGDKHPEVGAKLAGKLLGKKWNDFILGHSSFYIARNEVKQSKLLAPDKYWHCIIPFWLYRFLATLSGEWKIYRGLTNSRQVAPLFVKDIEWWQALQNICMKKCQGKYIIDKSKL